MVEKGHSKAEAGLAPKSVVKSKLRSQAVRLSRFF